jgi:hypothetical protein
VGRVGRWIFISFTLYPLPFTLKPKTYFER